MKKRDEFMADLKILLKHNSSVKWYFLIQFWIIIYIIFIQTCYVQDYMFGWIASWWKSRQFEVLSAVSGARGACNVPPGQWSYKRLCHCDKDMSRGFSDRDLLTWCWASILDQRVYWSSLNQSVPNCVWTFQSVNCMLNSSLDILLGPTFLCASHADTHRRDIHAHFLCAYTFT